jgi:hypothetical protein
LELVFRIVEPASPVIICDDNEPMVQTLVRMLRYSRVANPVSWVRDTHSLLLSLDLQKDSRHRQNEGTLILLDYTLALTAGQERIRQIEQLITVVPCHVLLLTDDGLVTTGRRRAIVPSAIGNIRKPFHMQSLKEKLDWRARQLLNEMDENDCP